LFAQGSSKRWYSQGNRVVIIIISEHLDVYAASAAVYTFVIDVVQDVWGGVEGEVVVLMEMDEADVLMKLKV